MHGKNTAGGQPPRAKCGMLTRTCMQIEACHMRTARKQGTFFGLYLYAVALFAKETGVHVKSCMYGWQGRVVHES